MVMGFRLERWITPIVALQSVLCVLELLDSFNVTIYPMVHRATLERTFSLGFSLVGVVSVLMLATSWYLVEEGRIREVLTGLSASVFLCLFVDFGVCVSVFSLVLVGITLMRSRGFQRYFTCLLALLAAFEGLALVHWILLPFGVVSPLAWFADLELSLFYVASYLAPLLVLPLMFMWVLRPVLRWVFLDEGI